MRKHQPRCGDKAWAGVSWPQAGLCGDNWRKYSLNTGRGFKVLNPCENRLVLSWWSQMDSSSFTSKIKLNSSVFYFWNWLLTSGFQQAKYHILNSDLQLTWRNVSPSLLMDTKLHFPNLFQCVSVINNHYTTLLSSRTHCARIDVNT